MTAISDGQMVAMFFHVRALPGKGKQLSDFLTWDSSVAQYEEPGTIRFHFFPDPECAEAFFVFEAYENEDAFQKHQGNGPFQLWKEWELESEPTVIAKGGITGIFEGSPLTVPRK